MCGIYGQISYSPNYRFVKTLTTGDTLLSDTLYIAPRSVKIWRQDGTMLQNSEFITQGNLILLTAPIQDSLTAQYRVIQFPKSQEIKAFSYDEKRTYDGSLGSAFYDPLAPKKDDEPPIGLKYSGTFARGLSFGNNQNLVLNSAFNLAISGQLTPSIEIVGALNDDNLPLQPEGNTQKLSEFDKVYIELRSKNSKLIAGDYESQYRLGHFIRYQKKMQGALVQHQQLWKDSTEAKYTASYALSRGKYNRYSLQTIEGNQGPYKLIGLKGEVFIIVLAGTERIYWDGVLLERGLDRDYAIDYNLGEVVFTAKRLITKDSRIVVEFDYTDQNYTRSLYTLGSDINSKRWKAGFHFYSEQDHKYTATLFTLDSTIVRQLEMAGDNASNTGISSIRSFDEGFTIDKILYKKIDTLGFNILKVATAKDSVLYTANFIDVGYKKGNYIRSNDAQNGRVYEWIPPDSVTGQPNGNYEPISYLSTPTQTQQWALRGEYDFYKWGVVSAEFSMTNRDKNTFSGLNDEDNRGSGGYLFYNNLIKIKKSTLKIGYRGEYINQYFDPINPYRAIEFNRNWNFTKQTKSQEFNQTFSSILQINPNSQVQYSLSNLYLPNLYKGTENGFGWDISWKKLQISSKNSIVNTSTDTSSSQFIRPNISLSLALDTSRVHTLKFNFESDINKSQINGADTLELISLRRDQYRIGYDYKLSEQKYLSFFIKNTVDFDRTSFFKKYSFQAIDVGLDGAFSINKNQNINWNGTFRSLYDRGLDKTTRTILSRINHQLTVRKGTFRFFTNLELKTGLEPKVEYTYVKVRAGDGIYFWNDFNNDSIAQVNEFEISPFKDKAEYIRLATVSNLYVETRQVGFGHTFRIEPQAIWQNETGIKKVLSKFSNLLSLQYSIKSPSGEKDALLLPFAAKLDHEGIIAGHNIIKNTVYFNRADPLYEVYLGYAINQNKSFLTIGTEFRTLEDKFIGIRYSLNSNLTVRGTFHQYLKQNQSQNFSNRNYSIVINQLDPEIEWQPNNWFRLEGKFSHSLGKNDARIGNESYQKDELSSIFTLQESNKSTWRGSIQYSKIAYNGEANSPIEFVMLDGLKSGNNWVWSTQYDRKISDSVTLSLGYDGRKTGNSARIIHVGKAQMRANF